MSNVCCSRQSQLTKPHSCTVGALSKDALCSDAPLRQAEAAHEARWEFSFQKNKQTALVTTEVTLGQRSAELSSSYRYKQ